MNNFPVNIEDYFARVLNIKMCMRKIFYPILLLALVACKGQQQTADSESVADPATESVNPEMGKNNGQSDADATAQPEVDAITSATSRPNQVSFNGRIVLPPQRQATVALTIGGVIKNTSLLPGQHVTKNSVIATLENPEFITLQQTYWTATHKQNICVWNTNGKRISLPNKRLRRRSSSKAKRIIFR